MDSPRLPFPRRLPLLAVLLLPLLAPPALSDELNVYAHGFTDAKFHCANKIHRAEVDAPVWDDMEKVCTRSFHIVLTDEARAKFCAVVDSRFFGTYVADPSGRNADQFKCIMPKLRLCGKKYMEHRGVCIHVSYAPMTLSAASTYCDNVVYLKQKGRMFSPLTHRDTEFLARTIRPDLGVVWLDPAHQERYKLLQNYDHDTKKLTGGPVFNVVSQMITNDSAHFNYRKPGKIFQLPRDATAHMICRRQGTQTRKGLEETCETFYPTVGLPTHYKWGECYYATANIYAVEFRSMRELHSHCKFDYGIRQRALSPDISGGGIAKIDIGMKDAYTDFVPKYKYHMSRVHSEDLFSIDGKDFFGFGMRLPIYNGALDNKPTFVDHEGTAYAIKLPITVNGEDFLENVKSLQDMVPRTNGGKTKYDLNAVFYSHVEDASGKREMRARLDAVVPHRRLPVMCQIKVEDDKDEPNYAYEDCPPGFIEYKTSEVGRTCLMMVTPDADELFWTPKNFRDHRPITTQIANALADNRNIDKMKTVYDAYEQFCKNYEDSRYPGRKVNATLARFANKQDVADSLSIFAGSSDVSHDDSHHSAMIAGFSKTNEGRGTDKSKMSFKYVTAFKGQYAPPKDAWAIAHNEPNNALGAEYCVQLLPDGKLNDIFCDRPKRFLCRIHEPLKQYEIY